jgi:AcrR family transcriptional regulator
MSRKADITRLKKSSSQLLAIKDRRKLVHLKLQQHLTIRQIAEQLGVTTATIVKDKKAIAKSLSVEHSDVKAIDLDDLDSMERECIDQLQSRLLEVGALLQDTEQMDELGNSAPKVLKAMYDNAGAWWDKRLRLKQLRGKWLGYEVKPEMIEQTNIQDNSIKVFVQAPGTPGTAQPVSFGEYARGILTSPNVTEGEVVPEE